MFHLTQLLFYIAPVACFIIVPYGIKNCTLVNAATTALSLPLIFNISEQRLKSGISAEGCIYTNFDFLRDISKLCSWWLTVSMAWGTLCFPYFLCHVALYSVILHRIAKLFPESFLYYLFFWVLYLLNSNF